MKGYILPEPTDREAFWCVVCNRDWMPANEAEEHQHHFERPTLNEFENLIMDALLAEGLLRRPDERERETWDYNVEVVKRIAESMTA